MNPRGQMQLRIMRRAHSSPAGRVMPAGYLEMRAVRRLVARGALRPALTYPNCWELNA